MEDEDTAEILDINFLPNQVCIAVDDYEANEPGDLSFATGDVLTIIRESEMTYWYIAKNKQNKVGTVPGNFLELVEDQLEESNPTTPALPTHPAATGQSIITAKASLPSKETLTIVKDENFEEDYQHMNPGVEPPVVPPKPKPPAPKLKPKPKILTEAEKQMLALIERDKMRRLPRGTLVVATATYRSKSSGDLSFKIHEEMVIIEPAKDLCWYKAHKADDPYKKGTIPLTHVRLVYMSDEEDEIEDHYQTIENSGHQRIYEDKNDFWSNSGWFTYPGLAMGRDAHLHTLARKADMSYEKFMATKEAVYMLRYMNEKTYIGKASVLHEELASHFECFGKRRKDIREIDDDLCHHTYAGGWKLKVWVLNQDGANHDLEVEAAKKVIEYDSLMSPDGGINETMSFTTMTSFNLFWEWLSPN